MDDRALERDIEALFAIEPTPDFRARLRHAVAQEPPLGRAAAAWRLSWSFAAGAALVAAVGIGVFLLRLTAPLPPPAELVARSPAPDGYVALPTVIAATRLSQRLSRRETTRSAPRRAQTEPEVIVDPLEAAAWRRLLADMSSGRVELARVAGAADAPERLPEGFVLAPVIIEPLMPDFREQGVHP